VCAPSNAADHAGTVSYSQPVRIHGMRVQEGVDRTASTSRSSHWSYAVFSLAEIRGSGALR
jgi:hypothetical protein